MLDWFLKSVAQIADLMIATIIVVMTLRLMGVEV